MPKQWAIISNLLGLCFAGMLCACGGGGGPSVSRPVVVEAPPPPVPIVLDQLRILIVGQSISSNCNEHTYGPVDNVLQIGRDGVLKAALDPFEWADCSNGSMWMPLGKLLIEKGVAKKVVFMPIGVAGTKVRDWQAGGIAFPKLNTALTQIKEKGHIFEMALWHQGSSDIGTDKNEYAAGLGAVISYINANAHIERWVIALHSRCYGSYDKNIEDVQRSFATSGVGFYLGPNNNLLGEEYRLSDKCHLNELGQEEMAKMWFDSIKTALNSK
jgi:hypothetical protein